MSKLIWADLYISDAWSAAAPWPAQDMERGGGGEQQAGMNIKANSSGRKGDIGRGEGGLLSWDVGSSDFLAVACLFCYVLYYNQ
jgi:hypothetical protein